jgi:hypothetical protein
MRKRSSTFVAAIKSFNQLSHLIIYNPYLTSTRPKMADRTKTNTVLDDKETGGLTKTANLYIPKIETAVSTNTKTQAGIETVGMSVVLETQ